MLALCWHQARSLVLRFEGEKYIFRGSKGFCFYYFFFFFWTQKNWRALPPWLRAWLAHRRLTHSPNSETGKIVISERKWSEKKNIEK